VREKERREEKEREGREREEKAEKKGREAEAKKEEGHGHKKNGRGGETTDGEDLRTTKPGPAIASAVGPLDRASMARDMIERGEGETWKREIVRDKERDMWPPR